MSLSHSPRIVTDGLVLCLDMTNTKKSWKGKPTTNLVSGPTNPDVGGWNGRTHTTILYENLPQGTGFDLVPVGCAAYKQDNTCNASSWSGNAYSYSSFYSATITGGTTYSSSILCYVSPDFSGDWASNLEEGTGGGNTDYNMSLKGTWQKLTRTWTPGSTAGSTSWMYWAKYGVTSFASLTGYILYCAPQMEVSSFVTPFVNGTRSNAQAIVDLTGNTTITAASLTYTSDNTFSFGTSDYIDLGSDILLKNSGGWAVESWVNLPTVNGASLYNFIGSTNYVYNCWFWTILNSKLAVWDLTQGVWKYGSTTILANTWYQCVLVVNDAGTGYQFYLNGIAEGGDHVGFSWTSSKAALSIGYIGRGNAAEGRYFGGKYPVFRAYNRALTATEVKQNFNALRGRYGV